MNKRELLHRYFGHEEFRPFQEEAVDALLQGRDLMMVLPTGGGKSLCYQLPTLMMRGVTVVISPLLALMHDQVTALNAGGIRAAMLSSMQSPEESREIFRQLEAGEIRLLYLAPERLFAGELLSYLQKRRVNFFVIDEAHCLSEWGHEFREEYRRLHRLKERFPDTPVAAFTATATAEVERDIRKSLGLKEPLCIRGSLYRRNLHIRAEYRIGDGRRQLEDFLHRHRGESGIIYTLSRKQTEDLALWLQKRGVRAEAFHAGLQTRKKRQIHEAFLSDRIETVVATVAFGMGIDKSNIRYVVHMSLPKSVEGYYQEMGRAGRDGLESETLLLYAAEDLALQRRFLEELPEGAYRSYAYRRLERLWRTVSSPRCRHRAIGAYFAEEIAPCTDRCDACLEPDEERVDVSEEARMFLSALVRSGQKYGRTYLVDLLRGRREKRILHNGHERLRLFGIGAGRSPEEWGAVADRLLEIGAVEQDEYRVLRLRQKGVAILKGEQSVTLPASRLERRKGVAMQCTGAARERPEAWQRLKQLRTRLASEEGVPPYIVFSDRTLEELARRLPRSEEEMMTVHGIGVLKFERYGKQFLGLIDEIVREMKREKS